VGTTNNFPARTPRKLFVGAFRDLERQLANELEQRTNPLAPLHVVCPTRLLALHLQRTLGRALPRGHINVRFVTLADFTSEQSAPPLGLELLCRRIARDLLSKGYFAPVHDTAGFATALLSTFTDLDEACLTTLPGKTPKLRELATAYAAYRAWLIEHNFRTEADLYHSPLITHYSPTLLYGFYDLNAAQRALVQRLAPAAIFFPSGNEFAQPLLDWFQSLGYLIQHSPLTTHHSPLTVLSCPGEPTEVREAFRIALDWLRENPSRTFNDIAILCRSRDQYDALFRDTLKHLGIPALIRGGRPLAEHSDAKLLLLLLNVISTDYARAAVMELACHLGPHSGWDALTIELGILGGRSQWHARLTPPSNAPFLSEERSFLQKKGLAEFVRRLFAVCENVPQRGRWAEFVEPVLAAFRQLGGQHAPVIEAVRALSELEPFQPRVTLAEFAGCCRQALEQACEPTLPFEGGGIFIGDVMSARGLSWPLVIVVGLVEKSFPRLIREDPLLLDDERRQISPDLPLKRRGHAEERMLFDLATASARERLVFSFPRIDTASARPRLMSCLLRPLALKENKIALAKFAHDADALDSREFDLALLKTKRLPVALLAEMSSHLARGLAAERARWGESKLTPHDGLAPAASAELPVSPTELETFAFCPFKYFCKQTLGLERWEEPEHIWSADPGEIGSAVHDILETFYKQASLPLQPKHRDAYRQQLRKLTEKRLAEFERDNVTGLPVVWSLRRAALLRDLLRFLDLEIERADDLVPREFEKKFGPTPVLRLSVCGRIDRVDTNDQRARILDYKTGKPWHKKDDAFDGGEALQLPLYALAAERAFDLKVVSSEYAYLSAGKYVRFSGDALRSRTGELARILETFAAMLRAGEFPQYTEHDKCGWCDYRPICGNAIEELAAKKIEDKRLAPFLAVKEIK
jgi:RecB family exonuclease